MYTITFTQQELTGIRQLLGQVPHDQIRPLIDKIQAQITETDNANAMTLATGDWENACRNLLPAEEFARIKAAAEG